MNEPPASPFAEIYGAEARDAARELTLALTTVGITLPHLTIDPTRHPHSPKQLINLGSVRPHIACMLAAAIRRGAATPTPHTPPRPTLTELAQQAEDLAARIHHHLDRWHHPPGAPPTPDGG